MPTAPSICRNCLAYCPILVTTEDGRAVKVTGDPEAPAFDGYSCPKGRALPDQHNDPQRLLHCLRRSPAGRFEPIAQDRMLDEIAGTLRQVLAQHEPRAIATYTGTGIVSHPAGAPLVGAFMRAIGSRMNFSAASIDKPAEYSSVALHGNWHAGLQNFETSDTWMIVGANPVIAKSNGAPLNNPGMRLKEAAETGMKLVVIDPRRTETARRAAVHLQPLPGHDAEILAGILRVVIAEGLCDTAFVQANAVGLETLRRAVDPFTPAFVAARAGIAAEQLLEAARVFAGGRRGGVVCATGPSFSRNSNLTYYLALCLNTVCGRWALEGDAAPFPNVLLPAYIPRAQPYAPYPVLSDRPMRVGGLMESACGVPTGVLADEILTEGPGQIRVLFCLGGNPLLSWPDQERTEAALRKLDLLVVFDYLMTPTASFAHYVVPPRLSLEVPGTSQMVELRKYAGVSRGYGFPWAQYTPAVARVPPGSDLLDDGDFLFRLAQRMGLQLEWLNPRGQGPNQESAAQSFTLDMAQVPSVDQLVEWACADARVPLVEVRKHPHGKVWDMQHVRVQAREASCTAMLQLADPMMMAELESLGRSGARPDPQPDLPLRLVSRRINQCMNSVGQHLAVLSGSDVHAPAALHPQELQRLGLADGSLVRIRSAHGEMVARVRSDPSLRAGLISVAQGFHGASGSGSVTRLIGLDERDPVSGIPRMSDVPVAVEPVHSDESHTDGGG